MKIKSIIASAIAFMLTAQMAYADSPLTSTYFANFYQNENIMATAKKADGIITEELMDYLVGKKNPLDVKLAVINELGWDFDKKTNAVLFMTYLTSQKGYKNEDHFKKKGSGDELICMAYLKALDNYFDVTEALEYANLATAKNKKSYVCHLIAGIIKGQKAFDIGWCEVFKATDAVRKNTSLKMDMKIEASDQVFGYMDMYENSCED